MKRLAIIPARSGSKSLKDKNIIDLCGKPLMAYTVEAALQTRLFDKVLVSTDSEHYAAIARQWGAKVMMRGEAQSNDKATTYDVLKDLLARLEESYDYFVLLQPTSPLRNSTHLREAIDLFERKMDDYDYLVSVKEAEYPRVLVHPLDENGGLSKFDIDYSTYHRHDSADITPNGAIFIAKPKAYLEQRHFFGANSLSYVMSSRDSIDIGTDLDLQFAKTIMKSSAPLISIVVPCYNVEKYVDECLDSLVHQTLENIEIICVDDCSTDRTLEKLTEWKKKDSRITVIKHDTNMGIGPARNTGIKIAKADYVGFVDSDDFVAIDKYECLYNLSQNGQVDLIASAQYYYYESNKKAVFQIPSQLTEPDAIKRHVLVHGFANWNKIVKKSLFFQNGLFYPVHLFYEDAPVTTSLFVCAETIAVYNDKPLHYYRRNSLSSVNNRKNDMVFFDRLETAIMFYYNTKRLGYYNQYKDEVEYAFFYLFYRNTILGALQRFDHLPSKTIKSIPTKYRQVTSENIRKNPYFIKFKPSLLVFLVAHYPRLTWLWRPLFKVWHKFSSQLKRIKKKET